MIKILICGNSFSADWTVKYTTKGWPNFLAEKYQILNLSMAGCGEYKIKQQLDSVDLTEFDKIIISHSSPSRIYIKNHPIHFNDKLHHNCDLIYTDVLHYSKDNIDCKIAVDFFEKFYDLEHSKYIHNLIYKDILDYIGTIPTYHFVDFSQNDNFYIYPYTLNINTLTKKYYSKSSNHMTDEGNLYFFNLLDNWITK